LIYKISFACVYCDYSDFLKIYISRGSVASRDAVKVWWYI